MGWARRHSSNPQTSLASKDKGLFFTHTVSTMGWQTTGLHDIFSPETKLAKQPPTWSVASCQSLTEPWLSELPAGSGKGLPLTFNWVKQVTQPHLKGRDSSAILPCALENWKCFLNNNSYYYYFYYSFPESLFYCSGKSMCIMNDKTLERVSLPRYSAFSCSWIWPMTLAICLRSVLVTNMLRSACSFFTNSAWC